MGFMNVLTFSAACFDFLGWPLFALGYPLCASIWAIETNSITDIKKLVSYWVLFSLISLFDHAFGKLLQWVPFWPYIKLMVICSLVIPHFDGAYYVYQHLVHPCLSMDPQVVMNRFLNESKKSFHGRENFLIAADRYVKENGAEALEKLLNSKSTKPKIVVKEIKAPAEPEVKGEQWKCEDPTVAQKKIQVVQPTQIKDSQDAGTRWEAPDAAMKEMRLTEVTQRTFDAAVPWVDDVGLSLGETRRDTTCAAQIKKSPTSLAAAEIEACRDHHRTPEISLHKEVQKEWACAMCLVTTQSEATFNSHLRGKRHKATSEALKAKTNGSQSASTSKKSSHSTKEELPKCTSGNLKSKMNGTSAASTVVRKRDNTKDSNEQMCKSGNRPNQDNHKKHEEKPQGHQKKSKKETSNEPKELGQRCNICNVTCTSEQNMASHLNGSKHLNRLMQLSQLWCSTCNVKCLSEVDMASHKNGKKHLEQLKKCEKALGEAQK